MSRKPRKFLGAVVRSAQTMIPDYPLTLVWPTLWHFAYSALVSNWPTAAIRRMTLVANFQPSVFRKTSKERAPRRGELTKRQPR